MDKIISKLISGILFYKDAVSVYKIHSPFAYQFVSNVLDTTKNYYVFEKIEAIRRKLLLNKSLIDFTEMGAGQSNTDQKKSIALIASTSLSPSNKCRVLFNLANYIKPQKTLEMGTSLGISTLYLGAAMHGHIITMEGNESVSEIAKNNFAAMGYHHIDSVVGSFEHTLSDVLAKHQRVDLVFLDGNHTYDATIKFFNEILIHCYEKTVIVLDDIYWSDGMTRAWKEIKNNESVSMTIDTFQLGFIFLNKKIKQKQHLKVIPMKYKPWQKFQL